MPTMQKSAVTTKSPVRFNTPVSQQHLEKGQKFEPFFAFEGERRSPAWLQKSDRKR
ncbi:hypothetical protein VITFI_CDS0894 [Vitreoscilla filiformis]|jgi:hypothetical protein|uniref:Uncharacterized protein n=2 Tax=Vitreoscilla filiformis TaxID=63 RepID=A0A221KCC1_VITFI|nr:hypothetical protein VITFI_CDS0894 [Vitreoscilla filiformis]